MTSTGFDAELRRVARHEAGHWLVGAHYGFDVSGIGRGFNTGQVEILLDRDTPDLDALRIYCEQRVRVLLAGYLAEHVANGKFDGVAATGDDWRFNERVSQDRSKFSELLAILSNVDSAPAGVATRQAIQDRLWDETATFLTAESATLDAISDAVIAAGNSGTLTTEQIRLLDAVQAFLTRHSL